MDVVECIHKEMRVNLVAQIFQLVFQILLFQFGQTFTVFAAAKIALDAEVGSEHQDKHHDGHDVALASDRRSPAM